MVELPSGPWQAKHGSASLRTAASSWATAWPTRIHPAVMVSAAFALRRNESPGYGIANTNTLLPRFASIWLLPPAATATYCLPPPTYDTAGALTPAPQLHSHSSLPLAASNAL